LGKINTRILTWCENHGYPFAGITYKDFVFEGNTVTAVLDLETENRITIDTIIVRGTSKLSHIYLQNYLSVKPGDLYNESVIRAIPGRIKELPMVSESRPYSIVFSDEFASIILNLEDKKASQIDGVIGILPDYNNEGKVQLTGDIRIRLLSSFGRGELLDLNWKNPQPQTQDLKIKVNYPFLFKTPLGIDFNLGIYKKDTTYLDVNLNLGLQFILKGGNYFKVFVNRKKSDLLSTTGFENITTLPPYADIEVVSYGIGLRSEVLDYRFNPTRGYAFEITGAAGIKTISENPKINEEVYDSLDLETMQYNGLLNSDFYFSIFPRGVVNLGVQSAGIGGEGLFTNELYRFGGLKTLRGFDEESLLASLYFVGKAEVRYLMEQNSFLFLFFNSAWYERNANTGYIQDTPFGFGAGITFETKLGIFSVNYALGREFENPVQFKSAKVHFGLVNYF
jgi:outer membrane protein assembly factor BamA